MKMYFLFKKGIFQPAMLVYQRVSIQKNNQFLLSWGSLNLHLPLAMRLIWVGRHSKSGVFLLIFWGRFYRSKGLNKNQDVCLAGKRDDLERERFGSSKLPNHNWERCNLSYEGWSSNYAHLGLREFSELMKVCHLNVLLEVRISGFNPPNISHL